MVFLENLGFFVVEKWSTEKQVMSEGGRGFKHKEKKDPGIDGISGCLDGYSNNRDLVKLLSSIL